jgi:hypothetical protein
MSAHGSVETGYLQDLWCAHCGNAVRPGQTVTQVGNVRFCGKCVTTVAINESNLIRVVKESQ